MYNNLVNNIYQTSLNQPISLKGIGLHSGLRSEIRILPAKANQGIIFKRVDLNNNNTIEANYKNVTSAKLCTTLENKFGTKVSTVEHLLAALYIAGIDNALIEINNEEVPIMDGSAKDFLDLLKRSSIQTLTEKRNFLKVLVVGMSKVKLIKPIKTAPYPVYEAEIFTDSTETFSLTINDIDRLKKILNSWLVVACAST